MANLCVTNSRRNTGKEKCDVLMKAIAYILVTDYEFTANDIATPAALFTKINLLAQVAVNDSTKIFVFPKTSDVTKTTAEPTRETLADGRIQTNVEPAPAYTLEYPLTAGQAQALHAFNGYTGKAYVVDTAGLLYYIPKTNGGGRGFVISDLFTAAASWSAYTGKNVVTTSLSFANVDEFSNFTATRLDGDYSISNIQQVIDIDLYSADTPSGNVITVGGRSVFTKDEIYDSYADALNDPDMWNIVRVDTGTSVVVSSTAKDAAHKGWDLTLAANPTIPSDTLLRVLLNLTNMHSDEIRGIESRSVIIPKA